MPADCKPYYYIGISGNVKEFFSRLYRVRHRSFDGGGRFWYNGIPTEGESGHLCQNLKEI